MADKKSVKERMMRELGSSSLLARPMRYRMPTSIWDAAIRYLHQVWVNPKPSNGHGPEATIELELFRFEESRPEDELGDTVGPLIADFLREGSVDFGGIRTINEKIAYIDAEDGSPIRPKFFTLTPTFDAEEVFDAEHTKDAKAMRRRLQFVERERNRSFPEALCFDWRKACAALETEEPQWVDYQEWLKSGADMARIYRPVKTAEGMELWLMRLPIESENAVPVQGIVQITVKHPRFRGCVVRLTPKWVECFRAMVGNILDEGQEFCKAFYAPSDED